MFSACPLHASFSIYFFAGSFICFFHSIYFLVLSVISFLVCYFITLNNSTSSPDFVHCALPSSDYCLFNSTDHWVLGAFSWVTNDPVKSGPLISLFAAYLTFLPLQEPCFLFLEALFLQELFVEEPCHTTAGISWSRLVSDSYSLSLCLLTSSRSPFELGNGMHLRMLRQLAVISEPLLYHLWMIMEIRERSDDTKRQSHPYAEKAKSKIWETAEQSGSFQFLGKLQNRSLGKLFPCTWRTRRWLGKASTDILRIISLD